MDTPNIGGRVKYRGERAGNAMGRVIAKRTKSMVPDFSPYGQAEREASRVVGRRVAEDENLLIDPFFYKNAAKERRGNGTVKPSQKLDRREQMIDKVATKYRKFPKAPTNNI